MDSSDWFVRTSCLCLQDDILMGTLSVRENLLFSANLRLDPKRHSGADKHSRVDAIIQDLGLADCAKTKVQTEAELQSVTMSLCMLNTILTVYLTYLSMSLHVI